MSKLTIKNNPVQEATEPAAFGKAYQDFVNRCWTDHKPNYSVNAINFLLDCAHIANGTSVKGLPQQGFKLTKAGNVDIVGDCLHLCYNEVNGKKAVDIWLNPHTQKAVVDLDGFNPEDPYSSTHKEFSARDYTSDDFCEFIEGLPNYKGESKTAESRKLTIRLHERSSKDRKIQVTHYGVPVEIGVDDLLQGLSRINSLNGNYWCFKVLGFDPEYISEVAPNHHWDSKKIIAGLGEDNVRKVLQNVIKNPTEYKEFLDKIIGWTDAKKNAASNALKNKAEARAEELRNQGYAVEVATSSTSGGPTTVYFAKKSDSPRCVGSGVPDNEVGGYTATMRNYLMDCDAGFIVYSRYDGYPVDIDGCSKRLSNKLGALTISDFKTVDSDYVANGADWQIIGSGKYGRQAVSYKLRLIRGLDAQEFYHNTPRKN